jgi:uncharacterized protein with von Willebrand factor type A (vWA) domain
VATYKYGAYDGGPDPLASPFDVRGAVDAMGEEVLAGASPADALRELLRRGLPRDGRRGLDDLLRRVRQRQREIRSSGRLDGILEQARALLDTAIGQERAELFPNPSDEARMREANLDSLPPDTSQAIRELSSYDWQSAAARETFERLRNLLRSEVLDSQFRGIRQALQNPDQGAIERVRDMLASLSEMLAADARGEHTQDDFESFMSSYGDMFPDNPRDLEELIDSLVSRMAAAERLLNSLSDEQREELADLMAQALDDAGLAAEMARLADALRARRPDFNSGLGDPRMTGDQPLGLSDATSALAELADLASLEASLAQDYPGASLDDIDEEAVRRAFGRQAVDDIDALRQIERELEAQGYLARAGGRLELTAKAVRRLGDTALRQVFGALRGSGRASGDHDQHGAGQAGELTGSTRAWEFGDEQPIDAAATVRNAVLHSGGGDIRLRPSDFEVAETERRSVACVSLLVDLSYSMHLRGTWGVAKQTALALHSLLRTQYPQDALQVVGFSNYARELRETELAGIGWEMVQGTNLHHALLLAGRHIDRHPEHEPVVIVITDGEPTAHLQRDGRYWFDWPPSPETLELTLAEVDKMTRRHATLNVFMLADDPGLSAFVDNVAKRNGGRVLQADPEHLSQYVIRDFLHSRGAIRR